MWVNEALAWSGNEGSCGAGSPIKTRVRLGAVDLEGCWGNFASGAGWSTSTRMRLWLCVTTVALGPVIIVQ